MPSSPSDRLGLPALQSSRRGMGALAAAGGDSYSEQVRLLYRNASLGITVNLLVVLVVTSFLWNEIPTRLLVGWLLCHAAVALGRWLTLRRYRAIELSSVSQARAWGRHYTVGAACSGLVWGVGAVAVAGQLQFQDLVFLAFALGGMAVGAIAVTGPVLSAYLAFMLPALVPLDLWLYSRGDSAHSAAAVLGTVLIWALYVAARHLQASIGSALRLAQEREQLIASLRDSEHRFRVLYDYNPSMYFTVDLDGTVLSVNQFGAQQLGYEPDELKGRAVAEIIHPEDRGLLEEALRRCQSLPDQVHRTEFRKLRRGGDLLWVRELVRLVPGGAGEPFILMVCDDITDRKAAEEKLRQHQEELAHMARLSTLGEMASGIAHELNQPLSAILNYAQGCARRLRVGDADTAALAKVMEDVARQAQRGGEIIRHLRHMVRKGARSEQVSSVNDLVQEVLRVADAEARAISTSVALELAEDLPPVWCDRIQIEQVILNLVKNALEAMRGVTRAQRLLTIHTRVCDPDHIEVGVEDRGTGFGEDVDLEQVFSPFFTTKAHGMGMGLAISRSIVESHSGRLWAERPAGGGARFLMTLPICRSLPPRPGEPFRPAQG